MTKVVSINPSTEEIYGELDESSASEINQKVKVVRENHEWGRKKIEERIEVVRKLIDLLDSKREELVRVMAMEMGKPLKAGRHEIEIAQKRISDYCNMIPSFISDEILFDSESERNIAVFEPVGTVVVISSWNAPVFVPLAMIVPALLCGNNVIWKPSEYTSFSGLKLNELFDQLKKIGLSENAFLIVIGGKEVGRKLVEEDVNMIALTGGVRAGMEVGKIAGSRLKKFVLEL